MTDHDELLAEYDASKTNPSQEWVDYESLADDLAAALRAALATWPEADVITVDINTRCPRCGEWVRDFPDAAGPATLEDHGPGDIA